MAIITNNTLLEISKEIEAENVVLDAIAKQESWKHKVRDWNVVKEIVQRGLANSVFSVGDQLFTTYTYGGVEYECPFDIVDISTAIVKNANGNEVEKPAIYLQMHYLTPETIQFDHAENEVATESVALEGYYYYGFDGTNYTYLNLNVGDALPSGYNAIYHSGIKDTTGGIAQYGYNRYSHSAVRQFLNSSASAGAWWTPKHLGDVRPDQSGTMDGFLTRFPSEFINVLAESKVVCTCNNITDAGAVDVLWDKFFLPSLMEMHINPQSAVEGHDWAYYQALQEAKFAQYGTYEILKRYKLNSKSSSASFWMRSAYVGNSRSAWYVNSSGFVTNADAYYAYALAPACVIC